MQYLTEICKTEHSNISSIKKAPQCSVDPQFPWCWDLPSVIFQAMLYVTPLKLAGWQLAGTPAHLPACACVQTLEIERNECHVERNKKRIGDRWYKKLKVRSKAAVQRYTQCLFSHYFSGDNYATGRFDKIRGGSKVLHATLIHAHQFVHVQYWKQLNVYDLYELH